MTDRTRRGINHFQTAHATEDPGMAMLLVVTNDGGRWSEADSLRQLSFLGITSLSVLETSDRVALLAEGWAFDVNASGARVVEILASGASDVTVFHPVVQMGVTARGEGGRDEEKDQVKRRVGVGDGPYEPDGGAGMGASPSDRHQPERGD
ncbi:MAG TPA: hypothetical protein VJ796_11135 [Acidimicrobiia bacterium]|jgi:hypothetical protein|nr:hypothetical protein [Acidimicrobiia bacterium]